MVIDDTLTVKELVQVLQNCDPNETIEVHISKPKKKRSLNANAYMWQLVTKIGNVLMMSKDDVYMMMVQRYGQREVISLLSDIDLSKYIKYFEPLGTRQIDGKKIIDYMVYKGSSEYDTREMSILIDGIVSECEDLGIETMTPLELQKIKESWK